MILHFEKRKLIVVCLPFLAMNADIQICDQKKDLESQQIHQEEKAVSFFQLLCWSIFPQVMHAKQLCFNTLTKRGYNV